MREEPRPPRRPLQFSLRGALVLMTAFAALFGLLQWLGVRTQTALLMLGILAAAIVAAVVLVLAIAASGDGDSAPAGRRDEPPRE
jgi:hypothetical protein